MKLQKWLENWDMTSLKFNEFRVQTLVCRTPRFAVVRRHAEA
jgi:hypothetical protein